jgi:hypothetical protein
MIRCALVLGIGFALTAEAGASCMLPPERHREPPAGYQDRGDRCEGLFVQPVSYPTAIEIVGLHAHPPGYDLATVEALDVVARGGGAADALQAISLRRGHHYQMDTTALVFGAFRWLTELLRRPEVSLQPGELAVLGCRGPCTGSLARPPTLVPVSVVAEGDAPVPASPRIEVVPHHELVELRVTLLDPDRRALYDNLDYGRVYYPPGEPITVLLDRVHAAGVHDLVLRAVGRDGSVSSARALLDLGAPGEAR